MFLTGIADEAGPNIEIQIKAHKELGWDHIEIRNVGGKNLIDINEVKFNEVAEKLDETGIQVCCFASLHLSQWAC